MKTFSNNFRSSLNNARQINGTACYYSNDSYYLLTQENDDSLLTELEEELATEKGYITYDSSTIISINPSFKANLYKTICKSVSIEAINKIDKNTNLCIKIGVLVDNSYEYMDYGYFNTIDEPTYKADTKSYIMIGYDKMIESMVKYDDNPLTITYPISHKNLVIAICNHFGWNYNLGNYTNYDKIIDKDLYSNQDLTYRDILDDLCQATGTNFLFNLNDVFTTKDITETNTTIDDNYIKDINVSFKEKYGKINALTITSEGTATIDSKEDTDSIALNGKTEFNINNNRLLLYAHDLFIDDLFAKIDGTEFYEFDIDTTGLLVYEPLDRFTINHDNTNYSCVMFGDDVKLTQGLVETIYTDKPTDAKSDYITSAVDDKKINNAIVSINKANAQIVLKANSAGKLVQAELNASADGGSQFNVKADNINLEGLTTINGNFKVLNDGSIEAVNGKFSGDIYLSTGGKVIGGDGLLTNLQYHSDVSQLGYRYVSQEGQSYTKGALKIDAYIPTNFTIISAIITGYVYSTDNKFMNNSGVLIENNGKATNINVYKVGTPSFVNSSQYGEFSSETSSGIKIDNALGTNGYTNTNASYDTFNSSDIKNNLEIGQNTRIELKTSNADLNFNIDSDTVTATEQTQFGYAVLNVIGYMSYE